MFFFYCREKGFRFVRIDGKMTLTKREQAVSSFMKVEPGSPTVILISLRAGGQGIILTAASRVFLMEPVSGLLKYHIVE